LKDLLNSLLVAKVTVMEQLNLSFNIGAAHIGLAFCLDLLIGDPRWLPHPVRLIGLFVERLEHLLRKIFKGPFKERLGGILLVMFVAGTTFFITSLVSGLLLLPLVEKGRVAELPFLDLKPLNPQKIFSFACFIIFVFLVSTTIATRELINSALEVINHLKNNNLLDARRALSMIVGRDTENLSEDGVLRATVESLSENLSDGVVAPLFYLTIGGLPLAMTYKAINTMDSMVGYKNERYRYFGWAAARLDDLINYIPARLTALLIIVGVFFRTFISYIILIFKKMVFSKPHPMRRFFILTVLYIYDFLGLICDAIKISFYMSKRTYLVILLDARNHPSPNSGYPESAIAGAIGIKLGGPSTYGGVLVEKPYIGISMRPVDIKAGEEALEIITISALIFGILCVLVKIWLI